MNQEVEQKIAAGFGHTSTDISGNSDRRCPTVLLLDVSGSMAGKALEELQNGLAQYIDEVAADSLARRRLEIAIVTFGGSVNIVQNFATPDVIPTPKLVASGDTPMGQAIVTGLDLLRERRLHLSEHAIPQYKPWFFLITDGGPTDEGRDIWSQAVERLRESREKKVQFYAVAVEGANIDKLQDLCEQTRPPDEEPRPPLMLQGIRFRALFQWITQSQKAITKSNPGDRVTQPSVSGWAIVES